MWISRNCSTGGHFLDRTSRGDYVRLGICDPVQAICNRYQRYSLILLRLAERHLERPPDDNYSSLI